MGLEISGWGYAKSTFGANKLTNNAADIRFPNEPTNQPMISMLHNESSVGAAAPLPAGDHLIFHLAPPLTNINANAAKNQQNKQKQTE